MYENVRYKVMQCVSFVSDWHTVLGLNCFRTKNKKFIKSQKLQSKHTIFRLDAHYSQTYLCAITK